MSTRSLQKISYRPGYPTGKMTISLPICRGQQYQKEIPNAETIGCKCRSWEMIKVRAAGTFPGNLLREFLLIMLHVGGLFMLKT